MAGDERPGFWLRWHNRVKAIEPWGILLAVVALVMSVATFWIDYSDRVQEREVRAWQLLTTKAPGNSGKIAALEYLNSEDGLICWPWLIEQLDWAYDELQDLPMCLVTLKQQSSLRGIDLSPLPDPTPETEGDGPAGVYLDRVNLNGADLLYANLQDARLVHADLQGADLSRTNLRGANLMHANLMGADLDLVDFSGAFLKYTNLQSTSLYKANLRNAILTGANLQGAHLRGAFLNRADLQQANLQSANLMGATLLDSRLLHANLQGAKLGDSKLEGATLFHADLSGADLQYSVLSNSDLGYADLSGAILNRARLLGADLSEAKLQDANLDRTFMWRARLLGADLRGASLVGANLQDSVLVDADMRGANLRAADLRRTRLGSADLSTAINLTQEQLIGACKSADTLLPAGISVRDCGESLEEDQPPEGTRVYDREGNAWQWRDGEWKKGW